MLLAVTSVNLLARAGRPQPDPLAVPLAEAASGYRRCVLENSSDCPEPEDLPQGVEGAAAASRRSHHDGLPGRCRSDLGPCRSDGRAGTSRRDPRVSEAARATVVTLQIVRGARVPGPARARHPGGTLFRPVITRQQDLSTALWEQGNALYVLSAPVDESAMAGIYLKSEVGHQQPLMDTHPTPGCRGDGLSRGAPRGVPGARRARGFGGPVRGPPSLTNQILEFALYPVVVEFSRGHALDVVGRRCGRPWLSSPRSASVCGVMVTLSSVKSG